MDFSKVISVNEVSISLVDKYLQAGWKLLAVSQFIDGPEYSRVIYSVGWDKDNTPIKPDDGHKLLK